MLRKARGGSVETFIATENIRRFKAMLATEADEQRRQVLLTLLEQEETKLQSIKAVRPEANLARPQ